MHILFHISFNPYKKLIVTKHAVAGLGWMVATLTSIRPRTRYAFTMYAGGFEIHFIFIGENNEWEK